MRPKGMKAADFWERRTKLIEMLRSVDEQIFGLLAYPKSKRAAERAKDLFLVRKTLEDRLSLFGVEVGEHEAVALAEEESFGDDD